MANTKRPSARRIAVRRVGMLLLAAVLLTGINNAVNPYTKAVDGAAKAGVSEFAPSGGEEPACTQTSPCAYTEVYEDGSGEHWLDWGGNLEHDLTWPAGSFPADGQFHSCPDLDPNPVGVCKGALQQPGAQVVR